MEFAFKGKRKTRRKTRIVGRRHSPKDAQRGRRRKDGGRRAVWVSKGAKEKSLHHLERNEPTTAATLRKGDGPPRGFYTFIKKQRKIPRETDLPRG